jgi:hypothetical protein
MKAMTSSTRVLAGAFAVAMLVAAAVPAQAAPLAAPRGAPVVDAPIETVSYKQRRQYRSNNRGAAVAAGVAIGVLGLAAAAAAANSRPRYEYYEPVEAYPSHGYNRGYVYSQPVQYRYYRDDRYNQYDDRYYGRAPRRAPPVYYDKEAAKQYWRQQKEIQKRAIKQGYYNQPYYGNRAYRNGYNPACTAMNPCYDTIPQHNVR